MLSLTLDPGDILRAQGMEPDAWQQQFLLRDARYTLLCCTRGGGKSRTCSAKALHRALFHPGSLILLISRSQRQSQELFRYVKQGYQAIGRPLGTLRDNQQSLELTNGSRVVALPGEEATIRSYQGVNLLLIDEAARVPDALYHSVRPMLGVSRGQLIALSTPFGQRGWFWHAWNQTPAEWDKIRITWRDCPGLSEEFIEGERRACGDSWVRQEFECSFESLSGLVYPDLVGRCVVDAVPPRLVDAIGGIDFGYRNPFAAVWGGRDEEGVLWLTGEHYQRELGLHDHITALPRDVVWYADPSHPVEINAMCRAGLTVRRGANNIKAGIAATRARIESDRLRIVRTNCPNLLHEAKHYHYPPDGLGDPDIPVDADNHALAALRYLISRIDHDFLNRFTHQETDRCDDSWNDS